MRQRAQNVNPLTFFIILQMEHKDVIQLA